MREPTNDVVSVRPPPARVRVDGYTRVCLTAIAVLLTVLVLGLWAERSPGTGEVRAAKQFLDSSAQRNAVLKAQETTNSKLGELISLLKSGQVKVQIAKDGAAPAEGEPDAPKKAK